MISSALLSLVMAATPLPRAVLTFPDNSVEVCPYTSFAFSSGEIDLAVNTCAPDTIFVGAFE